MAKPTLQVSWQSVPIVKEALAKQGLSQKTLAEKLKLHRSVISAFVSGKPVLQENFLNICQELGFAGDWEQLTTFPQTEENKSGGQLLVQAVRSKIQPSIQEWCGTMRVLDMAQPMAVGQIYTDVNVLDKPTAHERKTIEELLKEAHFEDFERFGLSKVVGQRILGESAVEKYQKLIVLGKPGSGKTTFLKHLAIQCIKDEFLPELVPIFINLKYFSEALNSPTLLEYIEQHFSENISELLSLNSCLILLDGLDEVKSEYYEQTINQIRDLSRKYHQNYFIITCRIAAKDYSYDVFDKFTEVEIADFDEEQIERFIHQWFDREARISSPHSLIELLDKNNRLYQLATTPLLLTLICLVFEESGQLPNSHSELYREGLEILLKKWDAKRGIQREQVYQSLSLQRKKDLLSYIALDTFKNEKFFFTQKEAEKYIKDYIRNLPNAKIDPETLQLDSEAILHSIEAQHGLLVERAKGIYSFSHLTFHEYFSARELNIRKQPQIDAFQELFTHLSHRHWREVFLLSAEMAQPDACLFFKIFKEEVDRILGQHERLQDFLHYIQQQISAHKITIHPAAIRAFYFDIDFDIDQERRLSLLLDPGANYLVCGSFFARVFQETDFAQGIQIAENYDSQVSQKTDRIDGVPSANDAMYIAVKYALKSERLRPELRTTLEKLYFEDFSQIKDEGKIKDLADRSRKIAKKTRKIGNRFWHFSNEEKKFLKEYYEANLLLVECLNTDCVLNPEHRLKILDNLLLPIAKS